MQITKVIENQISTPTTSGNATNVSSATCVRLCNDTGGEVLVSVSTVAGSSSFGSFTIPRYSVEFLQKNPTDVIFSNTSIKASKVGFTN